VRVNRVWCEAATRTGVTACADVEARGMRGETMVGEVRLRLGDRPVRAAAGARRQFAEADGVFRAASSDKVLHDQAAWSPFHIFVPYAALDLPAGQQHRLRLSWLARCGGASATADAEVVLRLPEADATTQRPPDQGDARPAEPPKRDTARGAIEAFLHALERGDAAGVKACFTPEQARKLPPTFPPTKSEHTIRQLEENGRAATAVVWVRFAGRPEQSGEFLMTLKLRRGQAGWQIAGTTTEIVLEPAPRTEGER
jgi:hypothetical protein